MLHAGKRVGGGIVLCGEEHLDFMGPQVGDFIPVLNILGISFPDDEYDRACVRRAAVWQSFLPVFRDQASLVTDHVDVTRKCQRDNIGPQAINNSAGLYSQAAVRLVNADFLPGGGIIMLCESYVKLSVKFAGRVV